MGTVILLVAAGLGLGVGLFLTSKQTTQVAYPSSAPTGTPASTLPARSSSESLAIPTTTTVVPDEVEANLQMFTSVLGDNFKALALQLQDLTSNASAGPEVDAPILGSWWALADWCATTRRGTIGSCYDQASSYYRHWFDRDPREINTKTWQGAGPVGDYLVLGYEAALGRTPSQQYLPELTAGRPGMDLLCTPSCAERMDPP